MMPVMVPPDSAASFGVIAVPSVVVRWTVWPETLTMCQVASTALTVTFTRSPELTGVGVPVLPEMVPGALVSPGSKTCNCVKARLSKRKYPTLAEGKSLLERSWARRPNSGTRVPANSVQGPFTLGEACKLKPLSGRVHRTQSAAVVGTTRTPAGPCDIALFHR